ncbi:hypothetical protein SPRG_09967 [Saprolegnia parasitica CBS 223.65]|uniref:Uncharacterized protein n=1 Tax=Saprolegnia parasitica (strain CBS 223.65) TaxID=695850 RepID=A0A067BXB1_SAPPC|nr:hypothetical protein SPRG_09967 [Saprolegnia parasitica CBS 223.65]KDO23159.1 hypothetical protein SPRG_09967 [Saprolegnia parasitica CBS 223.65]|eukprot:XP_012206111.1 hypothetical protein SPRG_09967 [Saprolegnia parasitica CBS 223.65]
MQAIAKTMVMEVLRRHGVPVLDNGVFVQPPSISDTQVDRLVPVAERLVEKTLDDMGKLLGPRLPYPSPLNHLIVHTDTMGYSLALPGSFAKLLHFLFMVAPMHRTIFYRYNFTIKQITCEDEYLEFVLGHTHEIFLR